MHDPIAVNEAFYEAFEQQDLDAMSAVWKQSEDVRCSHPGEAPAHGWDAVRASWRRIFESTDLFRVRVTDIQARVCDDLAVVVCVELITAVSDGEAMEGAVAATNVYERVGGRWLMVHHQGSGLAVRPAHGGMPISTAVN
jgi:ketosteroid isomerase-like protein